MAVCEPGAVTATLAALKARFILATDGETLACA
jgi:hypothetical protein